VSYTYSLLERALIYGPEFIAALAAMIALAAVVLPGGAARIPGDKAYKTAVALIFLACVFLYLYAFRNTDIIYGIRVLKIRLLLLALIVCLFALMISPDKGETGPYILCLAALASMHAAFMADKALLVFAAFITADCAVFAAIFLKKENAEYAGGLMPAKLFYALACAVFAGLFLVSGGKTLKMAQAGCVIFMILFSNPGLLAMRANDGEEGEKFLRENSPFILISGIMTAAMAAGFLSAAAEPAAARPVVIACIILSCVNIYRTITEEKYQAFAAHDSINPVFLLPALACGTYLPASGIVFPAVLFMLSVFLQNEFIAFHDHGRHTVAAVKYSFERVKGGWLAFFGVVSGLAAEICVFIMLYRYLKQDALIFAAIIFMALAFSISMLNKLFMVFSMLNRFKFNLKAETVFNKGNLRPAIFILFVAAVMAAWLK
jgi:hypothetical protein